jgi:hypothetical protein
MARLWYSFQEGGWAMYLVFAVGLTATGAAGRFAWRGEHQLVAFIRWMIATLIAVGAFGYFIGTQRMLAAAAYGVDGAHLAREAAADQRLALLLVGTREALANVSGSLMFIVTVCLLTAIGYRRFPLPNPSAVPR